MGGFLFLLIIRMQVKEHESVFNMRLGSELELL